MLITHLSHIQFRIFLEKNGNLWVGVAVETGRAPSLRRIDNKYHTETGRACFYDGWTTNITRRRGAPRLYNINIKLPRKKTIFAPFEK